MFPNCKEMSTEVRETSSEAPCRALRTRTPERHGSKDWLVGKISSTFNFSGGPAQPAQAGSHTLQWQVPEGLARLPPASGGRSLCSNPPAEEGTYRPCHCEAWRVRLGEAPKKALSSAQGQSGAFSGPTCPGARMLCPILGAESPRA